MRVALMQPYFFPYIGYFQLMSAVDCFVFYDEAQFMKGGWVNRNRILRDGAAHWWTLPVVHDSFRLPINARRYRRDPAELASLYGKFDAAYRRAPHYREARRLLELGFASSDDLVSRLNEHQLRELADALGIRCRWLRSSEIEHDRSLGGEARVIEICRRLGASVYLNPEGGRSLYSADGFAASGIALQFIAPQLRPYRQFDDAPVPALSILDVIAFNGVAGAAAMLAGDRLETSP